MIVLVMLRKTRVVQTCCVAGHPWPGAAGQNHMPEPPGPEEWIALAWHRSCETCWTLCPTEKGGFSGGFVHEKWGKKTVKQLWRKHERKLTTKRVGEPTQMCLKAQRGSRALHVLFLSAGNVLRPIQRPEMLYKACMVFQLERLRSSLALFG